MPDSTSDPEKYSIDEMLDRLKNRDDGEGELVTRADGTKAVKVRKRKRRTDQSRDKLKAQNQRMQLIQIAGFIIFIVAMLIIGGIMILYANSSAYRDGLISKIESATGSELTMNQFRMNPATASAARVEMKWPQGNVMSHFDAHTLTAKISPITFVGKVFHGQEIVAPKGNLFLTAPISEYVSEENATDSAGSLIKFDRYSVTSLNVFFSGEQNWDRMIENTEVSYLPTKSKKGGEIRLNQGLLKIKGWPSLALDRSYMHVRGRDLDIKSMRFQMPVLENQRDQDKGAIELSGVLSPLDEGATHSLFVDLDSFQISHLLGSSLGRFFRGRVITNPNDNSNMIQFTPGSGQDALLTLNMTNALDSRISLSQFKFMGQLAVTLDDRWYELPSFDNDVKLLMKRSGESVEIETFNLEQRGRMAIHGSMMTKDLAGNISGKFEVGIPELIIAASENRRLDALFSPVRDGYRWINLELGGTTAKPVDNFKELYQAVVIANGQKVKADVDNTDGVDTFDGLIEAE